VSRLSLVGVGWVLTSRFDRDSGSLGGRTAAMSAPYRVTGPADAAAATKSKDSSSSAASAAEGKSAAAAGRGRKRKVDGDASAQQAAKKPRKAGKKGKAAGDDEEEEDTDMAGESGAAAADCKAGDSKDGHEQVASARALGFRVEVGACPPLRLWSCLGSQSVCHCLFKFTSDQSLIHAHICVVRRCTPLATAPPSSPSTRSRRLGPIVHLFCITCSMLPWRIWSAASWCV
jgi:hypothetical protein